ncbi:MAG: MoxR family ATPase [Christensenellaceae bacterium]|nr:MoxR family ATPase [Christensenellaceae bacterium]
MINPRRTIELLKQNVAKVIVGKEEAIELALIALICKGHVLIEDVPGTGKTTLASALARSLNCSFKRIQFTPDVVPSDITGFTAVNFKTGEMNYHEGAVMSQFVLADEINRTSPKTQSSLLEAMEEYQVTVDGVTHPLPRPFMVLATQNPSEFVGTYPLPEAQLDRFFMRINIGYPTIEEEMDVLNRYTGVSNPLDSIQAICTAEDIINLQNILGTVYCSMEIKQYVATIAAATRVQSALQLGCSTRAAIALLKAGQACALLEERDYVLPDDIRRMVYPVLCHRMQPTPDAKLKGITTESILAKVMENVTVPVRLG